MCLDRMFYTELKIIRLSKINVDKGEHQFVGKGY